MLFKSSHAPSSLTRRVVAGRHFLARSCAQQLLPRSALPCLQQRNYKAAAMPSPDSIAVFGGGIAGLSSAYFISKEFPNAKITIFEAGRAVGGWIKTKRIDLGNGEDVVFEQGPRTLRNSTVTASLIQELGLIDQVTYTKKDQPGARNRYIYYPDRLNRLPSEVPTLGEMFELWRTGIFSGIMGLLRDTMTPPRPAHMSDETIGAFVTRRFDRRLADNVVSAGLHGIYAGDVHQLSARTLLGVPWALEGRYGTAIGGFFKMHNSSEFAQAMSIVHPTDYELAQAMNDEIDLNDEFAQQLKDAAMFTFTDGLQMLVQSLKDAVMYKGNVEIKTETPIQDFVPVKGGMGVQVTSGAPDATTTQTFDLAISTLRNPNLTPYVSVQTVNLYFATPPSSLLPVQGFGYLIPQSIPFEQNPERALGVIFDSYGVSGQDAAPGTKLTVMMGGHWWDGWTGYPTEEEGVAHARAVLERHLGITEQPVTHIANLSKDCIPQYTLGYAERLSELAHTLSAKFKGRLRVVGNQVNGVGVNDCITGAWSLARGLRGSGWMGRSCGLDRAVDTREWRVVPKREVMYRGQKGNVEQGLGGTGMDRRGDGGV
ncbi:hypothetical protein J1614_001456 [Plenodomus biglobosus]|nr:hypothetical protein J1614_001456 [Plenodomus biglobosus]